MAKELKDLTKSDENYSQWYNDLVVKNDLLNKLAEPSPEHILGCDEYGRDLLFRILWGTRYSLFAGVVTILAAILVGGTIGSIAGY